MNEVLERVRASWEYWHYRNYVRLLTAVQEGLDENGASREELMREIKTSPGWINQFFEEYAEVTLEQICRLAAAVGKTPRLTFVDANAAAWDEEEGD